MKAFLIAVQHRHQIDHGIVTRHQAGQVAGVVYRGFHHGQAGQVLDGFCIPCTAGGHGDAPAQTDQLFAHLPTDKTCAAQHQDARRHVHGLLCAVWLNHCVASSTQ